MNTFKGLSLLTFFIALIALGLGIGGLTRNVTPQNVVVTTVDTGTLNATVVNSGKIDSEEKSARPITVPRG